MDIPIRHVSNIDGTSARFPESNESQGACETLPGGLEPPTRAGTWKQDVLPVAGSPVGMGNHGNSTGSVEAKSGFRENQQFGFKKF